MEYWSLYIGALFGFACLLARSLQTKWQQRKFAQRFGCEPIKKYPHTHPLGQDLVRETEESLRAGRYNHFLMELYKRTGSSTYQAWTIAGPTIHTCEPANWQAVAATKFDDWQKDDRRVAAPFFGNGIFSANGAQWKHERELINPLFKRPELNDVSSFGRFVDRMVALIPRDGSTVDMQPLIQKLFLDSSTEFIFGSTIDSLRDTSGRPQEFLDAFLRALGGAGKRIHAFGPLHRLILSGGKQWKQDCAKVHAIIDECMARYFRSTEKDDKSQRYVLIEGMAKKTKDPVELRFQLLNIFYPANGQYAHSTANILFLLARNPSVWTELRKQSLALGDQPLTFELLKSLHLFRYTFFETMRLHSPANQVRRIAARDTVLPRGGGPDGSSPAFIPKGAMVYFNNYPIMHDPKIWGEDVDAFRPSRFEGKILGWDFTPFYGGPRICPASQQVISQIVALLVRLTREFESLENRDECLEFLEDRRMCLESRHGCKVALHPSRS